MFPGAPRRGATFFYAAFFASTSLSPSFPLSFSIFLAVHPFSVRPVNRPTQRYDIQVRSTGRKNYRLRPCFLLSPRLIVLVKKEGRIEMSSVGILPTL